MRDSKDQNKIKNAEKTRMIMMVLVHSEVEDGESGDNK